MVSKCLTSYSFLALVLMVAPFPLMLILLEELYYYAKDIDERKTAG